MDETRLELKVGALILLAIAGALALLWLMGELTFGSTGRIAVDFSHTGNVVKGAPVKLGGVQVGKIERIDLDPSRKDSKGVPLPVTMTMSLSREAFNALKTDTAVTVSSQGPLGEPYLEVNPGSAAAPFDASGHVRGTDAPRIDVVSNELARFLQMASSALEKDPDAVGRLLSGVSSLTHDVDGVLTDNRDDIRQIAKELAEAVKDLRAVAAAAKTQIEPGGKAATLIDDASVTAKQLKTDVPAISSKAQTALNGVANVTGQFTEQDGKELRAAALRLASTTEKLDAMAAKADRIFKKLEAGDGTLGAMIQDKQVYDDLKNLLSDLRKHPWKMLWKD
jgi:phospholipid/cholesterol/gamma-HCH transport system substrate-binding protein